MTPPGQSELQAQAQYGLSRVAAMQGNLEKAHRQAEASLHLFGVIGHRRATDIRSWIEHLPRRPVVMVRDANRNKGQMG